MTEGDLGEAAGAGLADAEGGEDNGMLPGMRTTSVKFVGMKWAALDGQEPKLGQEMTFTVRARCIAAGEEIVGDETVEVAKMLALNVAPVIE